MTVNKHLYLESESATLSAIWISILFFSLPFLQLLMPPKPVPSAPPIVLGIETPPLERIVTPLAQDPSTTDQEDEEDPAIPPDTFEPAPISEVEIPTPQIPTSIPKNSTLWDLVQSWRQDQGLAEFNPSDEICQLASARSQKASQNRDDPHAGFQEDLQSFLKNHRTRAFFRGGKKGRG